MSLNSDDLDAFLWEVETVTKQVHDILEGKVDMQKILEKERVKKEKKEKEEQDRKLKEEIKLREELDKKRRGVSGKGEKDNYVRLCKRCFVEFEIDCETCYHCNGKTITREERKRELQEKLEALKDKKVKKKFKKQQYQNWLKTESMLKFRTFKNYEKWDMYESSDEEITEPILPRHDPNFIALEKDLNETAKQREISRNKALKIKDEANECVKAQKFKKAIRLYGEAIEECKSIMSLYTNRALCYLKVNEYNNCVKDCERVIEYLEVFDDQMEDNKDLYVKALLRKALALSKMKNFEESIELISKAYETVKDEELKKCLANIELEYSVHKKALEVLNDEDTPEYKMNFEIIDNFIKKLLDIKQENIELDKEYYSSQFPEQEIDKMCLILRLNEKNKLYFLQKGGLEHIFNRIRNFTKFIDIIKIFNEQDNFKLVINSMNGYAKLIKFLFEQEQENVANKTQFSLKEIKLIVEILEESTQNEAVRKSLVELKKFEDLFLISIKQFDIAKKEIIDNGEYVMILIHFFTFICNVCYSSDNLKKSLGQQFTNIMEKLYKFIDICDETNIFHTNLFESIISFLINISCDISFREKMINEKKFCKFIINLMKNKIYSTCKVKDLLERGLSLLINLSFKDDLNTFYLEEGLGRFLIENIKENDISIESLNKKEDRLTFLIRVLMMISKLTKNEIILFLNEKDFLEKIISLSDQVYYKINTVIHDNIIRIFAHLLSKVLKENNQIELINKYVKVLNLKTLITRLNITLLNDYKDFHTTKTERLVNNMSLGISICTIAEELCPEYKPIIPTLISIAKDRTDFLRKNAAILLAKLSRQTCLYDYIKELHGIEVIMNIAKFLKL